MRLSKMPVQRGSSRWKDRRRSLSATLRMISRRERSWRDFSTSSFGAAEHVIDQRSIDIGATETDGIEERFVVCDKIPGIG